MLATVTSGLVAGLFYAFACSVMLGLRRVDDRAFIEVMQRINVAILNGWFAACFVGAPLLTLIALLLDPFDGRPLSLPLAAALAIHIAALAITFRANIPLNNALEAAGPPAQITDPAQVRHSFEKPWVRWNLIRAIACTAAFALLCWSLLTTA